MARPKFTFTPVKTSQPITGVDKEMLSKSLDDGVYPLAMAKEIRLDRIQPDPNQPRHSFDEEKLAELAASVREQGILQPIVVEYVDDGNYFRLVHGERRWRAATLAELQTIPAIIRKVDDTTRLARQLIENIQREDLNDVDRARALKQLKENLGSPSWEVIAQKVGISKRRVLQLVDITKLPEAIQDNIRSGELTEKHGRAAKMLPEAKQVEFAETVRAQQLSGDESLEVAKTLKAEPALPIEEAIANVMERQSQARESRSRAKGMAPEQGPEIVAVLKMGTAEPSLDAQPPVASAEADVLAQLCAIPGIIAGYEATADKIAAYRQILTEIIAAAQAAMVRLDGNAIVEPVLEAGE